MQGLRNIREAKLEEGKRYTQAAVAKDVGITPATLRAYERDPSKMTRRVAEKLASYLGCEVDDFYLATKRN